MASTIFAQVRRTWKITKLHLIAKAILENDKTTGMEDRLVVAQVCGGGQGGC